MLNIASSLSVFVRGHCCALLLLALPALAAAQQSTKLTIDIGHARLVTEVWGDINAPQTVLALPGAGGDVTRYKYLGPLIADAGYRVIAINQRGIMGSTGDLEGLTLHDYAADIAAIADQLELTKIHMVGWALGNRTSRVLATDFPDKVASVTLIAAGGRAKPLTEPGELASLLGNALLPFSEKKHLARRTLFSPATDDSVVTQYVEGLNYWKAARASQAAANRNTPIEQWWQGGSGPMLIVQGMDDKTAPPENGIRMKAEFGDRINLINLEDAGHLMGLEKPDETAQAIIQFLKQHPIE